MQSSYLQISCYRLPALLTGWRPEASWNSEAWYGESNDAGQLIHRKSNKLTPWVMHAHAASQDGVVAHEQDCIGCKVKRDPLAGSCSSLQGNLQRSRRRYTPDRHEQAVLDPRPPGPNCLDHRCASCSQFYKYFSYACSF